MDKHFLLTISTTAASTAFATDQTLLTKDVLSISALAVAVIAIFVFKQLRKTSRNQW